MVWFEIGRGRRDRGAQKAKKAHLSVSLFLIRHQESQIIANV